MQAEHVNAGLTRLRALQQEAALAYDAITAADDAQRGLAAERMEAERVLRRALLRHHAASRSFDAHLRARPGVLANVGTWFRAARDWHARLSDLEAALIEAAGPVREARRAVTEIKIQFAAQVHARAEAAAELRRLTAECARLEES